MTFREKLGLDGWAAWAVAGPGWLPPFMAAFLVAGVLLGAATLIEGRMPSLKNQYAGVWPGLLFQSISYGLLVCAALYASPSVAHGFWQEDWYNWLTYGLAALAVLGLAVPEYVRAYIYRNDGCKPADVLNFRQLHSPTCLAHRIIMFAITYLTLHVGPAGVMTVVSGPAVFLILGAGAGLMGWVFCFGVIDNGLLGTNRPRPDLSKIHPLDGGWFNSINWLVDLMLGETKPRR